MNSFRQPHLPASAKVLSLVRLHHGLPSLDGSEIPVSKNGGTRPERIWKSGARLNHLSARRRRIALEKIPSGAFPVILELANGSNFVIVHEREAGPENTDSYLVQFPDSREALVRGDRLREIYDGACVYLSQGASGRGKRGGLFNRIRERIRSIL